MKKMKMAVVFVSMVGMVFPMAGCALELVTTNAQGRYDMGLVRSNQNEVVGMIFDGTLMSNAAIVSAYGAADAAVVLQINTNSWNIASNTAGYAASDTVVSNGLVAAIASATPGNYSAVSNAALNAATATGLTVVSNLSVANAAYIADLATATNYTCSVAGSSEANTTFTYVSNSGAVAYFAGAANVILFGGTGGWKISENASTNYYYTNAATTATAPLTGWVSGDDLLGDYPVPVLETEFVFGYATSAQGATADAAQITNGLQQADIDALLASGSASLTNGSLSLLATNGNLLAEATGLVAFQSLGSNLVMLANNGGIGLYGDDVIGLYTESGEGVVEVTGTSFTFNGAAVLTDVTVATASGLTVVSNAANSIDTGVWLLKGNGTKAYYTNDVEGAYAATAAGDTLWIGNGTYYATNGWFGFDKPGITIDGAGRENTTLNVTRFLWSLTDGASNCVLRNIHLNHADSFNSDLVSFNGNTTNTANAVLQNLLITGRGASHTLQVTGTGGLIDNVISIGDIDNDSNGGGHCLVLKGADDWDVRNCLVKKRAFSGLLIKADTSMGNCSNIRVNNLICNGDILINTPITNGVISDVFISGVTFRDYDDNDTVISFGTSVSKPGTVVSNVVIDGVSGNVHNGKIAFGTQQIETINNVVIRNVSLVGAQPPSVAASTTTAKNYTAENINCIYGDKQFYGDRFSLAYGSYIPVLASRRVANISSGVAAARIPAAAQTNGLLYIACTASYELQASLLATNDPIWIVSGDNAGIHRLWTWGTASVSNAPFTGIVPGQFWFACTNQTPFSDDASVSPGEVRPGKCSMILCRNQTTFSSFFAGELTTRGNDSSGYVPQLFSEKFVIRDTTSSAPYVSTSSQSESLMGLWGIWCHVFAYNDIVYAGVFGEGRDSVSNPMTLANIALDLDMQVSTYQAAYYEAAGSLE